MALRFSAPTREDVFNWGRDVPLKCTAHLGQQAIGQGTEHVNTILGTIARVYREYADCVVYIDQEGYLAIEFWREGDGLYQGNPENGDETLVYWKQCASIGDARVEAERALGTVDGLLTADYFIGLGFAKEVL